MRKEGEEGKEGEGRKGREGSGWGEGMNEGKGREGKGRKGREGKGREEYCTRLKNTFRTSLTGGLALSMAEPFLLDKNDP